MLNANFTMCFMDVVQLAPDVLDVIQMSTTSRTDALISMLHAVYDNKEISAETIPEFKIFLRMKFDEHKDYYEELLDTYETAVDWAAGESATLSDVTGGSKTVEYTPRAKYTTTDTHVFGDSEKTVHTDLPRYSSAQNYPTSEDSLAHTGTNTVTRVSEGTDGKDTTGEQTAGTLSRTSTRTNPIIQKKKALELLRNVYREFAERFNACFLDLYM